MISPVHCASTQLPEIYDLSGRLENSEIVELDSRVVLVLRVRVEVVLTTVLVGIAGVCPFAPFLRDTAQNGSDFFPSSPISSVLIPFFTP